MAEEAERNAEAIVNALRRHAGNVIYPDYEPKDDFALWIAGYKEKVRNAFGFNQQDDNEVELEIDQSLES